MTLPEASQLIATPAINTDVSGQWADLGCGAGLFSKALLSLLPAGSTVHAVDSRPQEFTDAGIRFIRADFEKDPLPLPRLDGIIMANSLHFVKNKLQLLQKLKGHLKPGGIFILVEYDKRWPNPWVPYPLGFLAAGTLFRDAGFGELERIRERQSLYSRANIYSAWCS